MIPKFPVQTSPWPPYSHKNTYLASPLRYLIGVLNLTCPVMIFCHFRHTCACSFNVFISAKGTYILPKLLIKTLESPWTLLLQTPRFQVWPWKLQNLSASCLFHLFTVYFTCSQPPMASISLRAKWKVFTREVCSTRPLFPLWPDLLLFSLPSFLSSPLVSQVCAHPRTFPRASPHCMQYVSSQAICMPSPSLGPCSNVTLSEKLPLATLSKEVHLILLPNLVLISFSLSKLLICLFCLLSSCGFQRLEILLFSLLYPSTYNKQLLVQSRCSVNSVNYSVMMCYISISQNWIL